MKLEFATVVLAQCCTNPGKGDRAWGIHRARKIRQRLAELAAAPNLAILMTLPALQCRILDGDRQGQFAVDALAPFVLIFAPNPTPPTARQQQPEAIRDILLLEVTRNA